MVPQKAQGSGNSPGRGGARSPGGQAEGEDSTGAQRVLEAPGSASYLASRPSRPFLPPLPRIPWPRLCARDFFLWTPGVGCLRAQGNDSPSQASRDKINQPGPPPPPGPRSSRARSAWVYAGGAGNASVCWRHRTPASHPKSILPEAPRAEPFLPPAGPKGRNWEREWGRRASEPRISWRAAESAGRVVSSAHYLGRVVDVAVVRAYAAGRPGSGARDLRGGCGSRPFSNLIGLVVMWSAEASTITRGMFS